MKKILVFSMMLLLTACACNFERCRKNQDTQKSAPVVEKNATKTTENEVIPIMYKGEVVVAKEEPVAQENAAVVTEVAASAPVMVSYPCATETKCRAQEPIVLKPRVTEVVGAENKRPCCDDDNSWMYDENAETYVPDAPEIYVIAANRAFNTMQEEAAPLFKQIGKIKVYLGDATPKSEDLPGGIEKGMEIIKKRLEQTDNVTLVKNKSVADYKIDSMADWYDTPTKTVPAIKYDITFKDRGDNLVGEWSEIIHQAEGDRSWW